MATSNGGDMKKRKLPTSNTLMTGNEKSAIALMAGVHMHSRLIEEKQKGERKNLMSQLKVLKTELEGFLKTQKQTCIKFENEDGDTRYLRIVEKSSPRDVNPERIVEALDMLKREHLVEARNNLIKRNELEKSKKFSAVVEEAIEIILKVVTKRVTTDVDVRTSKERASASASAKGSQKGKEGKEEKEGKELLAPLAPLAVIGKAILLEKLKIELAGLKNADRDENKQKKMLKEKELEIMPILEDFMKRYPEKKAHRIDLKLAEDNRQELFLREKEVRRTAKWFTLKAAKPLIFESVAVVIPAALEFSDATINEFFGSPSMRNNLKSALTTALVNKHEALKPAPIKVVKLERSGRGRKSARTVNLSGPQKVNGSDDDEYDQGASSVRDSELDRQSDEYYTDEDEEEDDEE